MFSDNQADSGGVSSGGTWTVIDCLFSNNQAVIEGGLALNGTWTVSGSTFSNNSSALGGVAKGGTWTASKCTFTENSSTTAGGVSSIGTWIATKCFFTKNSATTDGGVANLGNWTATNSVFVENTATDRGGVSNNGTWVVANGLFVGNTAGDRGGVSRGSTWTVTSSTFFNNTATVTGGVARGGTWMATNNIFQGSGNNLLPLLFTNSALYEETPTPDKIRAYNLIDEEWTDGDIGEGFILNGDPLFVDPTDPNGPDDIWGTLDDGLHLDTGSAAIGFGLISFLFSDAQDIDEDEDLLEALPLDAAERTRILDGTLDLGAFEYVEPPFSLVSHVSPAATGTVTDSGNGGYEENETAILLAVPSEGFVFDHWEGDASGSDNPVELLIDSNKDVTAVFLELFDLTSGVSPEGSGTIADSGNGSYKDNETATVTATAAAGFVFDHWEGDATGSTNPVEILMDAD
ncbi:MAG: hypothetical protein O3C20_18025, partial [Verrucomicrobia bacterium]|nr:hypothetical protein [Verrucomicrobiota bacterium]